MYGKELGKDALTIFCPQTGDSHCRFSIFFCGCKQPKSIHILISAAKVRLSVHNTKGKTIFFYCCPLKVEKRQNMCPQCR